MGLLNVENWPDKWYWDLMKPLEEQRSRKTKKEKYKYTLYISNGETMFSEKHVALFIDGDSIPELMQKGHDTLLDEISKKEATVNAAKRANKENKTYLVCQKFDKSYWFVLQEKYIEKQYNDKIVKTIHPER